MLERPGNANLVPGVKTRNRKLLDIANALSWIPLLSRSMAIGHINLLAIHFNIAKGLYSEAQVKPALTMLRVTLKCKKAWFAKHSFSYQSTRVIPV
jgi:hypothetical protein